jgi:tyrosyl-tRNA synthetase
MDIQKRLELIKRNTAEILTEEDLKALLKEKKNPVIYWGTAPTGKPHVGYFLPMLKVADFLKAGFKVKILLADLHAALDNTPWPLLEKRYEYYSKVIPMLIKSVGVDVKNLEIIKGSDFQLQHDYVFDVLHMSSLVSVHDAHKAASEVVKMGDNPKLSGLIYPIMQAIDEQYLGADAQLGGTDQRKIMVLARENLPKLGYNPRVEVMNPLVPGLIGKKMSASDEKSKIDLMDDEETVIQKLKNAECIAGEPDNGILAFLKYVIMPLKSDKKEKFIVKRDKKFGGNLEFSNYEPIEKLFVDKKLHPLDLKNAVAGEINKMLKIFRENKKALEKIASEAYPSS